LTTTLSRRSVITNGGVAALAVGTALALSACSSAPGDEPADSTGGLAPGTVLISLDELAVGSTASVKVDGVGVLLNRTGENAVVAFSSVCTHQGCAVDADFTCPCHGSRYDPVSGENLAGPAPRPLPAIDVAVRDDSVVIA